MVEPWIGSASDAPELWLRDPELGVSLPPPLLLVNSAGDGTNQRDVDGVKIYLALASLANVALAVFGLLPAMTSPMLFDAPGSQVSPVLWALAAVIWLFSVVALASAIAPWMLLRWNRPRAALVSTLGGIGWFLLLILPLFLLAPTLF